MASLDQLSARERQLVFGLGFVFLVLVVVFVPFRVSAYLSKRSAQNEEVREAIGKVQAARGRLALRRAMVGDVAARYANKAPPLGTLIDTAAKSSGLEIAQQTDTQPIPRGKLYSERASKLTVQKTGLKRLAEFLEHLEAGGYPVAVTQFDMSRRIEPDSYTVNMTVTAYDRSESSTSSPTVQTGSNAVQ
ncbi:MAG: hypothetical protein NVS3B20_03520 [Polyangiales bacterium]